MGELSNKLFTIEASKKSHEGKSRQWEIITNYEIEQRKMFFKKYLNYFIIYLYIFSPKFEQLAFQ